MTYNYDVPFRGKHVLSGKREEVAKLRKPFVLDYYFKHLVAIFSSPI